LMLILAAAMIMASGWMAVAMLVIPGFPVESVWWELNTWRPVWDAIQGRVTVSAALTANTALLGACVTIVIAVTVNRASAEKNSHTEQAKLAGETPDIESETTAILERVENHVWRSALSGFAGLAGTSAIVVAVTVWTADIPHEGVGAALITDILAMLTVGIVTAIQVEANRAVDLAERMDRLSRIAERKILIENFGQRPPNTAKPSIADRLERFRNASRALSKRPAAYLTRFGSAAILLTLAAFIIGRGAGAIAGEFDGQGMNPFWIPPIHTGSLALFVFIVFVSIAELTILDWTNTASKRSSRNLIWGVHIRNGYFLSLLGVTALAAGSQSQRPWASTTAAALLLFVGPLLGTVAISWSRQHQRPRIAQWFADPVWSTVQLRLQQRESTLTAEEFTSRQVTTIA
ncbi:hypothetical protein, partial [Streptomyces roseolus]|uniref:hypothetical protein n=1 Tax=Streptomyces roseolus TaxID=67358 RepID=UPI003661C75F